jgi:hypothetical protein
MAREKEPEAGKDRENMSAEDVKVNVSGGGIGFFSLLGLLFVGLKLGGVIDWSWFWVTCPLWFGLALAGVLMLFAGLIVIIMAIIDNMPGRRMHR